MVGVENSESAYRLGIKGQKNTSYFGGVRRLEKEGDEAPLQVKGTLTFGVKGQKTSFLIFPRL